MRALPAGPEANGVYYRSSDYAGLGRRLVILLIDGTVLFVALLSLQGLYALTAPHGSSTPQLYGGAFVILFFAYFALLGRSRWGTLGYTLTSVKVVDLRGHPPSVPSMLYRTLLASLGPVEALINVVWSGGDVQRQAVHDKLAATYVVRRGAEPEGHGRQVYATYNLFGYTFTIREIRRDVGRQPIADEQKR